MNNVKRENRRRGPDTMVKAISIFSGIAWLLVILVFFLFSKGKPRMGMTFFSSSSQGMDQTLMGFAGALLFVVLLVCVIGVLINMNRHKRRSDRFNKSLIIFGIASIFGLFYYFLFV